MRVYSWQGHGNLGDDWIFDVAEQHLDAEPAHERRRVRGVGRYRLVPNAQKAGTPLLLWGGGWLAADRADSDTLARWARHVQDEARPVHTFGLGLGPFDQARPGDVGALNTILASVVTFSSRTQADAGHLPDGVAHRLACDPVILDRRFVAARERTRPRGPSTEPYVVISLPAWRPHWAEAKPWLDEDGYNAFVDDALADAPTRRLFVEFDSTDASRDMRYWSRLQAEPLRPSSIEAAADAFVHADRALVGRLHAALLAGLVGTPALAIGYHHKFESVEELGVPTVGLTALRSTDIRWGAADQDRITVVRRRGAAALAELHDELGGGVRR